MNVSSWMIHSLQFLSRFLDIYYYEAFVYKGLFVCIIQDDYLNKKFIKIIININKHSYNNLSNMIIYINIEINVKIKKE